MPMGQPPVPGEFSRRSFFLFLLLAPLCLLCVLATIVTLQYRQFKSLVSPSADIPEFAWDRAAETKRDTIVATLSTFAAGSGDSLWLSSSDMTLLMAASPAAKAQGLRFSVEIGDSVLALLSTQPVQAMQGKVAWIFRKLGKGGYLNARVEVRPRLEKGILELEPERGFLNNQKIPRAALVKRGGLSPGDFMNDRKGYEAFVRTLAGVTLERGKVVLVRK